MNIHYHPAECAKWQALCARHLYAGDPNGEDLFIRCDPGGCVCASSICIIRSLQMQIHLQSPVIIAGRQFLSLFFYFGRCWFGWVEIFIRKWKLQAEKTPGWNWRRKMQSGCIFSTLVLSHSSFMVIQSFPIRIKSRLADGNSLGQTPDPRLNFCRVETGGTSMAVYHGSKYGDLASWKVEHLFV